MFDVSFNVSLRYALINIMTVSIIIALLKIDFLTSQCSKQL